MLDEPTPVFPQQAGISSANLAVNEHATGRIVRKTAVDLVVEDLRTRILAGLLPPGAALRQEALAEQLGVSRIPIREAIRLLSSEGLVEVLPHRGAYVTMLSLDEVREFFDLRLRLEPWLVHEAAHKTSAEDLDRAEHIVVAMDSANASDWGRLNWHLHESLYRAAERPNALEIVRGLHAGSERYLRFQVVIASIRAQAHEEHMHLIECCRHHRADDARDALQRHILVAANQILDIVAKLLQQPVAAAV